MLSANCTTLTLPARPSNVIIGFNFTLLASVQHFLILDERWSCQITFCSLHSVQQSKAPAQAYLNYCLLKLLWYSFSLGSTNHTGNSKYTHTSYTCSQRPCSLNWFWNQGCYNFLLPVLSMLQRAKLLSTSESNKTALTFVKNRLKKLSFLFIYLNKKFFICFMEKTNGIQIFFLKS